FCCGFSATASIKCGPDSFLGLRIRIAQRHQGAQGVVRRSAGRCRSRPGRLAEPVELVAEIEYEPLCFLPPYTRNALQCRNVFLTNGADEARCGQRREHADGERRSDAVRSEQLFEQPLLEYADESEQLPGIFLYHQRRVQRYRFA